MTHSDQIELILQKRYNGYKGEKIQKIKLIHELMRENLGDKLFLVYLKEIESKLPEVTEYKIPQKVVDTLRDIDWE
jgi:hypothetical protein